MNIVQNKILIIFILTIGIYESKYFCCRNEFCTKSIECNMPQCYIGLKKMNLTDGKYVNMINQTFAHIGCWAWDHEKYKCPTIKNHCYFTHDGPTISSFCCFGNHCNNSTKLICVKRAEITKNVSKSSTPNLVDISNQSPYPNIILIVVIFSIITLLIIILYFIIQFKLRHPGFLRFRKVFYWRNLSSSENFNGDCFSGEFLNGNTNDIQCDNHTLLQNPLINSEINQGSKYYRKTEKKSIGKFGEIWLGDLIKQNQNEIISIPNTNLPSQVAIKIFKPSNEQSWETELEIYRYIRNRCSRILHFIGFDKIKVDMKESGSPTELWLLTSYMERGSLYDCLQLTNSHNYPRPSWPQVVSICRDIAAGLSYLHEDGSYQQNHTGNGRNSPDGLMETEVEAGWVGDVAQKPCIAHRDLKSRNVLIGEGWQRVCIADMGLAVSFQGNRSVSDLHVQVGTHRYMSPEVLEGAISFSRDAFLAIDVYAMSLVMWEVLSQSDLSNYDSSNQPEPYSQPFERELGHQITIEVLQDWIITQKKRPHFPKHLENFEPAKSLWKTIVECWDKDAEARLSSSCVYERLGHLVASHTEHINNKSDQHISLFNADVTEKNENQYI